MAKQLYEGEFKHYGLLSSAMRFHVVESIDGAEPTPGAEVKALLTSRLQTGLDPKNLNSGSYLLAVVDSWLPTLGKQ